MDKPSLYCNNILKRRIKKTIIILSLISLIMYSILFVMKGLNRYKALPFGFDYSIKSIGYIEKGRLNNLNSKEYKIKIYNKIKNHKKVKSIIFYTQIYSSKDNFFRFHLSEDNNVEIFCNNKFVKIRKNFFNLISLKKGFNLLKIHYSVEKILSKKFIFFMDFGSFSKHIPYYHYTLPKSTISKLLSYILTIFEYTKSIGFFFSFLIIFILIGKIFFVKKKSSLKNKKEQSLAFLFYELFCLYISVFFCTIFLNFRLNINLSLFSIYIIVLLFILLYLYLKFKEYKIIRKIDKKKVLVFFLLIILVFTYIYIMSGKLIPIDPIGAGDLSSHMMMANYFKDHNAFITDEKRIIYPQVLNAFIAILSDIINVQPEKIITLFLTIIIIWTLFIIYVLIEFFFNDISIISFFIAILTINFTHLFKSFFFYYYYPPLISIFFFMSALLFLLKKKKLISSLSFATSLVVYPYFLIMFSIVIFFLLLNQILIDEDISVKNIFIILFFFIIPAILMYIYIYIFISRNPSNTGGFCVL